MKTKGNSTFCAQNSQTAVKATVQLQTDKFIIRCSKLTVTCPFILGCVVCSRVCRCTCVLKYGDQRSTFVLSLQSHPS